MGTLIVVVVDVLPQHPSEVALRGNQHPVQAFPPAAGDPPFGVGSRAPGPVQPPAPTVPSDYCRRLDEDQVIAPIARPQPGDGDPQDPIAPVDARMRVGAKSNTELVAHREVLEHELPARLEEPSEKVRKEPAQIEHPVRYHQP